jgi:hypothetical protein
MTHLQWFIYLGGFFFFLIGCYLYYLSKKENLTNNQKITRKRGMNFCLIIALICVGYSWL